MASSINYQTQIATELLGTTARSFDSYFKIYDDLIARSDVHVLQIEEPGPEDSNHISHDGILAGARVLRENPKLTLDQASQQLGARLNRTHSRQQLKFAILVAVRAMLMLDCAVSGGHWESWQPSERLVDFVSKCFPKNLRQSDQVVQAMAHQKSMKAWKLKARLGISFKGTDNLARHLLLDSEGPTIYLFHHTAFLKAQLDRLQKENFGKEDDVSTCLQSGCLPPRLLAETLHSLQAILFHFDDRRSSSILERLINRGGFDEDCAQPEGYKMFDDADKFEYLYWGERLATLHEFILNRPPRNKFERWIKWQTSDSNAFAIALAALIISIVVGVLTLGLAGFQAWIAWKAWKEPVSNGNDTVISLQELIEWIRQQEEGR
ncbi:hypothetical protein B0J13DRAFT_272385 [Dactylonectria estremocensis]|uniref:Uncharacterized protein n=1 Tax=Dactylonectria estremocensis TaxID=1079267 RepID=A0A9P9D2F1_9HYPO|nr:hypothetical protein B0J13DRAFT_272385 [Dactylonectria estremocensis]